jgi:capsular polysaccharide export protein
LRIFGGNYRTVQQVLDAVSAAATELPEGWSIRIKEHPTSNIRFDKYIAALNNPKLILDNATDTFEQVSRSKAVLCVNSSVGLEAMFYDKPVIAMGDCFWAIPGIADHCPTDESLKKCVSSPELLTFSPETRAAFMSYLIDYYYPVMGNIGDDGIIPPAELQKIIARL